MMAQNIKLSIPSMDIAVWNTLFAVYFQQSDYPQDTDEYWQWIWDIHAEGSATKPNAATFNIIIYGLIRRNKLDLAQYVVDFIMPENHVDPNSESYAMITATTMEQLEPTVYNAPVPKVSLMNLTPEKVEYLIHWILGQCIVHSAESVPVATSPFGPLRDDISRSLVPFVGEDNFDWFLDGAQENLLALDRWNGDSKKWSAIKRLYVFTPELAVRIAMNGYRALANSEHVEQLRLLAFSMNETIVTMGCVEGKVSLTNIETFDALIRIGRRDGGMETVQRIIKNVLFQPMIQMEDVLVVQQELFTAIQITHSLRMYDDIWLDRLKRAMWRIKDMVYQNAYQIDSRDRRYGIGQLGIALGLNSLDAPKSEIPKCYNIIRRWGMIAHDWDGGPGLVTIRLRLDQFDVERDRLQIWWFVFRKICVFVPL